MPISECVLIPKDVALRSSANAKVKTLDAAKWIEAGGFELPEDDERHRSDEFGHDRKGSKNDVNNAKSDLIELQRVTKRVTKNAGPVRFCTVTKGSV